MTLEVWLRHRQGPFMLDVSFRSEGRVTALFGRSGAGKTTIVNAIAGLVRPDAGLIRVDGNCLFDGENALSVPTRHRRIGYVFQDARLFPHLSVRQNLSYGRWFAGRSSTWIDLEPVVDILGIKHLLHRRPSDLSGGEKQRVAIGRAMLADPRLLLMDEPLVGLDAARKAEVLPFLEQLRDRFSIPIVYVSHALAEVARLASDIIVLEQGRIIAAGEARHVMARLDLFDGVERQDAGALLDAEVVGHEHCFGLTILEASAGRLYVPFANHRCGARVRLRIQARDVTLAIAKPDGLSAQNILPGRMAAIGRADGPVVDVSVDCNGDLLVAQVTKRAISMLSLEIGLPVFAVVKSITLA